MKDVNETTSDTTSQPLVVHVKNIGQEGLDTTIYLLQPSIIRFIDKIRHFFNVFLLRMFCFGLFWLYGFCFAFFSGGFTNFINKTTTDLWYSAPYFLYFNIFDLSDFIISVSVFFISHFFSHGFTRYIKRTKIVFCSVFWF